MPHKHWICIFTATFRALDPHPPTVYGKVLSLLPELSILYFQEISIQHQYSEYTRDICIKSALGNEQISPIWNLIQITSGTHVNYKLTLEYTCVIFIEEVFCFEKLDSSKLSKRSRCYIVEVKGWIVSSLSECYVF